MFQLKSLSKEAVPAALTKADRYRLLNEPAESESICLDILEVAPEHQQALALLLLSLTEQFDDQLAENVTRARELVPRLRSEYEREYYSAIIHERRAKAQLHAASPGAKAVAYQSLREAMSGYERAEALRPHGNDDALLRWNACARTLIRAPELEPGPEEPYEPYLE